MTVNFEHVTTDEVVEVYGAAIGVFGALLHEVRELSKKKPDATLSASKVKLINNVLSDLLSFLEDEPEGKYLAVLEDESLPQVSDALMMMVQVDAACTAFKRRYYQYYGGEHYWITEQWVAEWNKRYGRQNDEDED